MAGLPGIVIKIAANTKDAVDGLNKVNSALGRSATAAEKSAARWEALGKGVKGIAVGAAAAIGFDRVTDAIGQSITAASDLNESLSKSNVVFGMNARNVERWADTMLDRFNVTEQAALESASTYGNLFSSFGVAQDKAATMSKRLVEHAADLAAFGNTGIDEALAAITSGISGEMEPLKRYGVTLLDVRVKEEARTSGLWDGVGALSLAAKSEAAFNLILKDSKNAIGAVDRESAGYSQTLKAIDSAAKQGAATIGQEFLNAIQSTSQALGGPDGLKESIGGTAESVADMIAPVGEITGYITGLGAEVEKLTGGFIDLGGGIENILNTLPGVSVFMGWRQWGSDIRDAREESLRFVNTFKDGKAALIGLAQAKNLIPAVSSEIDGIGTSAKTAKTDVDRLKGAIDALYGRNQSRVQQRIELRRLRQEGPGESGQRKTKVGTPGMTVDQFGLPVAGMTYTDKMTSFTTADDARLFGVQYAQKASEYAQTFKSGAKQAQILQSAQDYIAQTVDGFVKNPQRFASSLIGAPDYLTSPGPWEFDLGPSAKGGTMIKIDKVVVQAETPGEVTRKLKDWQRYKASGPGGPVSPFG